MLDESEVFDVLWEAFGDRYNYSAVWEHVYGGEYEFYDREDVDKAYNRGWEDAVQHVKDIL